MRAEQYCLRQTLSFVKKPHYCRNPFDFSALHNRSDASSILPTMRSNISLRPNPGDIGESTSTTMVPGGRRNLRRGQKAPEFKATGTHATSRAVYKWQIPVL